MTVAGGKVLLILLALALAAQQPRDVRSDVNTALAPRSAQLASPPPAAPAPLARFGDVPNVAVTYYDVAGRNIAEIHKSVAKLAPKDPETKRVLPATSSWTVAVKINSLMSGKRCTVTAAKLDFRGAAVMPRLAPDKDRPAAVAAAWATYFARLEARQAEQLRFAYDRLAAVHRAVLGSRCDKAEAAADAILARLREQQRLAFRQEPKEQPRLEPPAQ